METKLSKREILNEMIAYYSEDTSRRSNGVQGGCVYNNSVGDHCAVGRCFKPEYKDQGTDLIGNEETSVEDLVEIHELNSIDDLLDPVYQGHELQFWKDLQILHDFDRYWDENGLSELGIERVKIIRENFGITE